MSGKLSMVTIAITQTSVIRQIVNFLYTLLVKIKIHIFNGNLRSNSLRWSRQLLLTIVNILSLPDAKEQGVTTTKEY